MAELAGGGRVLRNEALSWMALGGAAGPTIGFGSRLFSFSFLLFFFFSSLLLFYIYGVFVGLLILTPARSTLP
jgi:hypothetical protein